MKLRGLRVLILAILLSTGVSWANPNFRGTPAEEAALRTLNSYKLVKLRTQAQEVLKANPESYAGHFLLGFSLHNSEGDLPRAKFHLDKSLKYFIKEHSKTFNQGAPWGWYEKTLMEMAQVNAEMDAYEEQIKTLDEYMRVSKMLFGQEAPSITALYAWPLMKLEREADARAKLQKISQLTDPRTRSIYLNTLGALEMEFDNPAASYAAFKQLVEEVQRKGWGQSATYLRNLGEASAGIGRFDEAEKLFSEATRYFDTFTYSNPWFDLTFLYLSQGRFPEAVSALKKTHQWRFSIQPFLAQQSWAQDQHASAELLLHLGESEKALTMLESIVQRPDRQGGDSIQLDQKQAGTMLLYRSVLLAEAARVQESLTWTNGVKWWKAIAYRRELLARARMAQLEIRSLASNNDRLSSSLRPYYAPGTFIVNDWHRPDLSSIYGAGVAAEALSKLYENPSKAFSWEKSSLEVIRGEIAWASGDEDEAIDILRAAIPELGQARALLRARAEARLASILFDEGRFEEAIEVATRVFDTAPAMFRHLDVAIPVIIETDENSISQDVAKAIGKSPRFDSGSRGYHIKVTTSGDRIMARLLSPQRSLLAEASVSTTPRAKPTPKPKSEPKEGESDDKEVEEEEEILDPPDELVSLFHRKAFAPRIDLSQRDINSLDGSTVSDSRRTSKARDAIGLPRNGSRGF